jgi:hypothetical protein
MDASPAVAGTVLSLSAPDEPSLLPPALGTKVASTCRRLCALKALTNWIVTATSCAWRAARL